jgi:hypothetical protein
MQRPEALRGYAEECRRLAKRMPEHSDALLQMAKAWMLLADEAERKQDGDKPQKA